MIIEGFENWRTKETDTPAAVFQNFEIKDPDVELLYAVYTQEGYEGSATVVFKKDNQLFLVEGWHCSCNGLEGQWVPTPTSVEALRMMPTKGYYRDLPRWAEFLETL